MNNNKVNKKIKNLFKFKKSKSIKFENWISIKITKNLYSLFFIHKKHLIAKNKPSLKISLFNILI